MKNAFLSWVQSITVYETGLITEMINGDRWIYIFIYFSMGSFNIYYIYYMITICYFCFCNFFLEMSTTFSYLTLMMRIPFKPPIIGPSCSRSCWKWKDKFGLIFNTHTWHITAEMIIIMNNKKACTHRQNNEKELTASATCSFNWVTSSLESSVRLRFDASKLNVVSTVVIPIRDKRIKKHDTNKSKTYLLRFLNLNLTFIHGMATTSNSSSLVCFKNICDLFKYNKKRSLSSWMTRYLVMFSTIIWKLN